MTTVVTTLVVFFLLHIYAACDLGFVLLVTTLMDVVWLSDCPHGGVMCQMISSSVQLVSVVVVLLYLVSTVHGTRFPPKVEQRCNITLPILSIQLMQNMSTKENFQVLQKHSS